MTDLTEEVARAIVADLERGCPLSGSSMRFDPVTGVVDYEGAFRPVEIAQAAIAIVLERLREPTPEMIEAGEAAWMKHNCMDQPYEREVPDIWQAMLERALSPNRSREG